MGNLGFALGSTLAGVTYDRFGYRGDTLLSGSILLLTAWVLWRFLPEPAENAPVSPAHAEPEPVL
jgi:predicted MFS family arabinose efflux permease